MTVIYSFIVVMFFLLISMHFIHLFSILLPVCFNKFSVQCSVTARKCAVNIILITSAIIGTCPLY